MIDFFGKGDHSPLSNSVEFDGHPTLQDFKDEALFMLKSKCWKLLFRIDKNNCREMTEETVMDGGKLITVNKELPFGYPKPYYTFEPYLLGRDKGTSRQRLAVLPEWSDLGRITILLLPPHLIFYEGVVAPQPRKEERTENKWLRGGARQVYIPKEIREDLQTFTVKFLKEIHMLDYFLKTPPNTEWDYNFIEKLQNVLASNSRVSNEFDDMMGKLIKMQTHHYKTFYEHSAEALCMKRAKEISAPHCFGNDGALYGGELYQSTCPEAVRRLLDAGHNHVNMSRQCNFVVKTPVGLTNCNVTIKHPYQVHNTAQGCMIYGG